MKSVFAASLYWVAGLNPLDQWHQASVAAEVALGDFQIVTTKTILIEVLNYYGENTIYLRKAATRLVKGIFANPGIEVVMHTSAAFHSGLQPYEARPDKGIASR